ncbi:MAG TPA: (2Fe-2S)-binding protein [Burkholderiales bacterium]|jgi:bacterioferritin-associated ferredoxin|nr:(2Fe-2S)-binding protein [Burkholderiales bacterium]
MYICICHGITDHQIRDCVKAGCARTLCDLQGQLGVATQCGCCEGAAMQVLHETLASPSRDAPQPRFPDIVSPPFAAAA